MEKFITLNPTFSTTRMLTKIEPIISDDYNSVNSQCLISAYLPSLRRIGEGGLRNKGYFKSSYNVDCPMIDSQKSSYIPLISIITVVFNGEKYLEQAIKSVIEQTYNNIEYIIIDGGSTDGTLDIIRRYEDKIDYWVSEPDGGLYDAMNKGIYWSFGDVIGILNSDDLYLTNTVEEVVKKYKEYEHPCVIYGSMLKFFEENLERVSFHKGDLSKKAFQEFNIAINHPTCFVHRELYNSFGGFQPKYEVGADRDLMIRFYERNVNFIFSDKVLAKFRLGGTTSSLKLTSIIRREIIQENELLKEHNLNRKKRYSIIFKKVVNVLKAWMLYKIFGKPLAQHIIMLYLSQKYSKI